jgi:hypothetical protein
MITVTKTTRQFHLVKNIFYIFSQLMINRYNKSGLLDALRLALKGFEFE